MGRQLTLAMIGILFFPAAASAAMNVAVFNFQMKSDTPDWRWLEKGLADRIATDFVQSRGLSVVAAGCSTGDSQGAVARQEWVTEWVSRHVVVTGYRLLGVLSATCNPRFRPEKPL
jgi:TolB-like protein